MQKVLERQYPGPHGEVGWELRLTAVAHILNEAHTTFHELGKRSKCKVQIKLRAYLFWMLVQLKNHNRTGIVV